MARRKRVGDTTPAKLFIEDIIELKRRVNAGEWKSFSEAVRYSVNNYLTIKRMEKYGDTGQMTGFKTAQLQLLQPLIDDIRDLKKVTAATQAEFIDNRSVLAQLTRIVTQTEKTEVADSEVLLREVLAKLDAQNKLVAHTQENTLLIKGLMMFFTLGYQAGKIKPIGQQKETVFIRLIEDVTKNTKQKARQQLNEKGSNEEDESLVRNFAQELLNKIYEIDKKVEQKNSQNKV